MTASTDIEKINKWIWGNGKKGADTLLTEHGKDIESVKEDLKCKADASTVDAITLKMTEMSGDIKTLLKQSGGNVSIWWLVSALISVSAIAVAIFK
jgi:hypothetical protein